MEKRRCREGFSLDIKLESPTRWWRQWTNGWGSGKCPAALPNWEPRFFDILFKKVYNSHSLAMPAVMISYHLPSLSYNSLLCERDTYITRWWGRTRYYVESAGHRARHSSVIVATGSSDLSGHELRRQENGLSRNRQLVTPGGHWEPGREGQAFRRLRFKVLLKSSTVRLVLK